MQDNVQILAQTCTIVALSYQKTCTDMHTCLLVTPLHVHTSTYDMMHAHSHTHTHTHTCAHTHTHTHAHARTHTHTCMHTHRHNNSSCSASPQAHMLSTCLPHDNSTQQPQHHQKISKCPLVHMKIYSTKLPNKIKYYQ